MNAFARVALLGLAGVTLVASTVEWRGRVAATSLVRGAPGATVVSTDPARADTGHDPPANDDAALQPHGVTHLVETCLARLALSEDQRLALQELRGALRGETRAEGAAAGALANTLADGLAAGVIVRSSVDAALAQLTDTSASVYDVTSIALTQLHFALGAEQRASVVDILRADWNVPDDVLERDLNDASARHGHNLASLLRSAELTEGQAAAIASSFRARSAEVAQTAEHLETRARLEAFSSDFQSDAFEANRLDRDPNADMVTWGATLTARFLEVVAPVLTPDQRERVANDIRARSARASE